MRFISEKGSATGCVDQKDWPHDNIKPGGKINPQMITTRVLSENRFPLRKKEKHWAWNRVGVKKNKIFERGRLPPFKP